MFVIHCLTTDGDRAKQRNQQQGKMVVPANNNQSSEVGLHPKVLLKVLIRRYVVGNRQLPKIGEKQALRALHSKGQQLLILLLKRMALPLLPPLL